MVDLIKIKGHYRVKNDLMEVKKRALQNHFLRIS